MSVSEEYRKDMVVPEIPASEEEFLMSARDSVLGFKMGRQLPENEVLRFFDKLWRNHVLQNIDENSDPYTDKPILKNFAEALQYPFYEQHSSLAINSLLGNEHISFAFTGGYIFLNKEKEIQIYLAKKKSRPTPFGDFHDIAAGQFKSEYGVNLRKMPQSQRCLFFHTWHRATNSIEYFLVPIDIEFNQRSHLKIGEQHNESYISAFSDQQILEFEKKYSEASYGLTQIVIADPSRRDAISDLGVEDQLLPKVTERMQLRIDHVDMPAQQALREAMREMLLGKAGVKDAFSKKWNTKEESHWSVY